MNNRPGLARGNTFLRARTMATGGADDGIDISTLPPQQLFQLKQDIEQVR